MQEPANAGSSRRPDRPPISRRAGSRRVACREQDRELMRSQALCRAVGGRGPPGESSIGKPLVAKPKSLAVIRKQLHGRRPAIAEDEDGSGERIVLKGLLTESRQAVDPATEIDRLDRDEDLHLGRDLEHHRAFQKLRDSASTSAAA